MAFDSSYLLTQVKVKASPPEGRYSDAEILQLANDCMISHVVPMIISLKEEFYVTPESQNITANVSNYPIPYRALGLSLREVKKIQNNRILDLDRMSPEDIITTETSDNTEGFYLQGQDVVLYPTPSSTQDILKLYYFLTPSRIVTVSECAAITAIDTGTGIVTATPPTSWTTSNLLDFCSKRNGHKTLGSDITPTAVSSTTVTFSTSDLPSTLSVGDYIALAGETPYLQCPDTCFDLVVRLVSNELLESMGAQAELQAGLAKANELKSNIVGLLTNRVTGAPKRSVITLI
jgi:hypothetical protein